MSNIIEGYNFVHDNTITMDLCPGGNCHGTKMAGIIAAKTNNAVGIAGVAGGWYNEGVKILPVVVGNTVIEEQHLLLE